MDPNLLNNPGLSSLVYLFVFFCVLVAVAVGIIPYWKIFSKAGFSPWLALCMLIPVVNLVVLYVVAFSRWKVVPYPPQYPPQYQQQPPFPPQELPGQQRW